MTQSWGWGLGIYFACELFILAVNSGEGWDRDVSGGKDLNGEQGDPGGKLMKTSEEQPLGDSKEIRSTRKVTSWEWICPC